MTQLKKISYILPLCFPSLFSTNCFVVLTRQHTFFRIEYLLSNVNLLFPCLINNFVETMSRVPISEEQAQQMMAKQQAQQERMEAFTEQKENMMRAFVSAEGRERLQRIAQVKPERAQAVEMHIIQAVQKGKMQPPVSDDTVRELLGQMASQESEGKSHITIVRKRTDDDW